jgi:hypothetical protein
MALVSRVATVTYTDGFPTLVQCSTTSVVDGGEKNGTVVL